MRCLMPKAAECQLLGCSLRSRALLGSYVCYHFTQSVYVSEHLIEMLGSSFKLRGFALLLVELHGVLERVQLFQQFRDRTAEVLGFGSSSRH
jgi:hypothetical protein